LRAVEYLAPEHLGEVLEVLAGADPAETVVWAGGTALGPLLRRGLVVPRTLLGLERVRELAGLSVEEDGSLRIGAAVRLRELYEAELVRLQLPALAGTARRVGNVRVQNVATVGGHLAHADPAQDLPPVLLVLDAEVRLYSRRGARALPLEEFLLGPMQTARAEDELVTEVRVPPHAFRRRIGYVRYTPRSPEDYPTVGVAASVEVDAEGVCREVRVAVGGAGPKALRVRAAEQVLVGGPLSADRCREAARRVEEEVDPWDDARGSAAYKRAMARVWAERLLQQLAAPGP
jgi:carbon-monoxide dehydrogenase medium subunit